MTGDEIITIINNPATTMTISRSRGDSSFLSKSEHHRMSLTDHHDWQSVFASMGVTSISKVGSGTLFHGGVRLKEGNGISISDNIPDNGLDIAVDSAYLDVAYVKKGGDTMTGILGISLSSGNNLLYLDSGDATPTYRLSGIELRHDGTRRWRVYKGNNANNHLDISRYDATGALTNRSVRIHGNREQITINDSFRIQGSYRNNGAFYSGTVDPGASRRLNYNGYLYASRFYNAIYNDIADFIEIPEGTIVKYGFPYFIESNGSVRICKKGERSIGIATDTYGLSTGVQTNVFQMPIAVSGFALAHVDGVYKFMDPLVVGAHGLLTKANILDRIFGMDRVVGWFFKEEKSDVVYGDLKVNGRHWIKVK